MKPDAKLYLVTRRDLSPGQQAVQAAHALHRFVLSYHSMSTEWSEASSTLAIVTVADEKELMSLMNRAAENGLCHSHFHEPDVGWALTAVALEPSDRSRKLCRDLPLALG